MNAPVSPDQRNRNRGLLVLIVVLFFGSALVAGMLRVSGWRPAGMKNHGELLQPPGDLRALQLSLADGAPYRWDPGERTWRIAVAAPAQCGAPCEQLVEDLELVWQLSGHRADHVHILWSGSLPQHAAIGPAWRPLAVDPALRAGLPRVDDPAGVPVYIIDPNGFVILRYAPGFDRGHLRTDLARLLKLK